VQAVKDEAGWEVFRECMYGVCNAADNKPYARCYVEFTNESAVRQCEAYADPGRAEDYKKYWNNVFLAEDMRKACAKKGGKYDPVLRECSLTITLKQISKKPQDAKGVKLADNVGCDNVKTITQKVGAGSLPCSLIAFGIDRSCLDADQEAINDNKSQKKTALVTGLITGAAGVAGGILLGFTNKTCVGGTGTECLDGTMKFNKGLGIGTAVTGAIGGVSPDYPWACLPLWQPLQVGAQPPSTAIQTTGKCLLEMAARLI
jgi:hypothetical protein